MRITTITLGTQSYTYDIEQAVAFAVITVNFKGRALGNAVDYQAIIDDFRNAMAGGTLRMQVLDASGKEIVENQKEYSFADLAEIHSCLGSRLVISPVTNAATEVNYVAYVRINVSLSGTLPFSAANKLRLTFRGFTLPNIIGTQTPSAPTAVLDVFTTPNVTKTIAVFDVNSVTSVDQKVGLNIRDYTTLFVPVSTATLINLDNGVVSQEVTPDDFDGWAVTVNPHHLYVAGGVFNYDKWIPFAVTGYSKGQIKFNAASKYITLKNVNI